MMPAELYEVIRKRKSVRKYEEEPLGAGEISEILEFWGKALPLYPEIKTEARIVPRGEINLFLPVSSPHYLMLTSEPLDGHLENAGFLLQQMDLFLSSKGYGSCYVGMALPSKEARKMSGLEYVIVLAFGRAAEPLHRTELSQFRRKSLREIADMPKHSGDIGSSEAEADLLECVRLSPSATNGQPWFLVPGKGRIDFYCVKPGFIKAIGYRKMNKIDMGIAICHCFLAAGHAGFECGFSMDSEARKRCPDGYYYTGTVSLDKTV